VITSWLGLVLSTRPAGDSPGLVTASSAMTNADTRPPTVVIVKAIPDVKLSLECDAHPAPLLRQFVTTMAAMTK